jgi:cytochrome b
MVWGFVGSTHARFSDFVRSPAATLRYTRELMGHRAKRYTGHNPAGAAMIVVLLIVLHVAGVLHGSYVDKENLVRAMYKGTGTINGAGSCRPRYVNWCRHLV